MTIFLLIAIGINTVLLVILFIRQNQDTLRYKNNFEFLQKNTERLERLIRDEMTRNREENSSYASKAREEGRQIFNAFSDALLSRMTEVATLHKNQLDSFAQQLSAMTQMNEQKLERLRSVLEERLTLLQQENSQKLEKMREIVDEKLHATLEKRLGESFKVVSERLEKVHQGLGEMQTLASGVGDLKKVLSNVKTRGILGEVQLENLLEQLLTSDQYAKNIVTKRGSQDPVDFVIKLPYGLLPIDAKFPTEDYQRLQEAQEKGDVVLVEESGKALENRIKLEAKKIKEKYLDPPQTIDFGILFLPFEGLYAEVTRRPGLFELVRRDFKVVIAGPTNVAMILNGFQMGFRSLAVQKYASEVWALLGTVKTEFNKFGDILEKTHKKLQEASDTIETAARKSRTIEKKLRGVEDLPVAATVKLLEDSNEDVVIP